MSPALLSPMGLPVVTTAQRDALAPTAGQLVWNSERARVERYGDGRWEAFDDEAMQLIGALTVEVGRLRSAIRFLGVEPGLFTTDLQQ